MILFHISFLIIALFIGSFINVLIHRLPRGESIVWPPSHCTSCRHRLGLRDLVPVFSYLWLKGRCRYCQSKIPGRYFIVEVMTAALFFTVYWQWGMTARTLAGCLFTAILIAAAYTDLEKGIIPDRLTYPGIILGLALSPFTLGLAQAGAGGGILLIILTLAALLSDGGVGGGDIKLAMVTGCFTGVQGAVMILFLSSIMAGLWALILAMRGRANRKTAIKFGPFLAVAAFGIYNWQAPIAYCYFHLFS